MPKKKNWVTVLHDLLTPMGISFQLIAGRISLFRTPVDDDTEAVREIDYKHADLLPITGKSD